MLQLSLDPGFVEEPRLEGAVLGVVGADDLHDQRPLGALDAGRGGQVDFAHSAPRHAREQREAFEQAGQRLLAAFGSCGRSLDP